MFTFAQYRREYETTLARLEAEYQRLPLQEKSRRVLGRDNPLLYSSQAVAAKMTERGLSTKTVARQLDRQAPQFESIAYHTLVRIPLRRIPLPEARWIFLDFTGQVGGWRYRRAQGLGEVCAPLAPEPPPATRPLFLRRGPPPRRLLRRGAAHRGTPGRPPVEEFSPPGGGGGPRRKTAVLPLPPGGGAVARRHPRRRVHTGSVKTMRDEETRWRAQSALQDYSC